MKQFDEILKKTQKELQKFSDFVLKWQKTVNLIAPSTIPIIWDRHIVDSAQLYLYIPADAKVLADMGSGGGFPAIVLAIINKIMCGSIQHFYLIESDVKKSVFLREAARVFELPVTVINERLEKVSLVNVDVVTARALKSVEELFELGRGIIKSETVCLFLKGENVHEELKQNSHKCRVEIFPSVTHNKGCILKIGEVQS